MAKNDPPAPVKTLLHIHHPHKANVQAARIGLDRLRLWVRGDTSVKLDDGDIGALENVSAWLRDGVVLDAATVRLLGNAIRMALSIIADPYGGPLQRDNVERIKRALEMLPGE